MSSLCANDCNDIDPLLHHEDESNTETSSTDIDDIWAPLPSNRNTTNTMPKNVLKSNINLFRQCKNHSIINSIKGITRRRKRTIAIVMTVLVVIHLYIHFNLQITSRSRNDALNHNSHVPGMEGYLVWSDKCKMPNIDPYLPETMQFFRRRRDTPCSRLKPLTKVIFNMTTNKYILQIDQEQVKFYRSLGGKIECCYQIIDRNMTSEHPDDEFTLSNCISFLSSAQLANTTDNILVKCRSKGKQVYINGYPMMPERNEIRERLSEWSAKSTTKPVSILMIGIDSVSRINLIRAMPKTAQYLYDNEWFEMSGYNKMDDNTFPNFMAILTGYNLTSALNKCQTRMQDGLDKCPFIWKTFRQLGYVTAYAEDEAVINTFNYLKKGFIQTPVDYYMRPFILSAEKNLIIKRRGPLNFCLGFKHSADYIYDYAIELATRYQGEPFFGLFWANSFSHLGIDTCSSMDDNMLEYLRLFSKRGILDESIVIFFSDHGIRFGPTRKFLSGNLEERLPFMFIWLPLHLKHSHPQFINALHVNKNHLTNPYDIHMTLKHILEMSNRTLPLPRAPDCPECQTLLRPVPHSRSCDEIAIEDHWCTCIPYVSIPKDIPLVEKIAKFSINYMNTYVAEYQNGSIADMCARLHFGNILSAYHADANFTTNLNATYDTYRIVFTTKPNGGMFESTVRHMFDTGTLIMTGSVSRLNEYGNDTGCLSDSWAAKYCLCVRGQNYIQVP